MKISQREVCRRSGVAPSTYNQWEKAVNRPDLDEAIKLRDALDLTLDWIYLGDPGRLPHALVVAIEEELRKLG